MGTAYFVALFLLCLPPCFYLMFRVSVETWLRRKRASKGKIKKLMKGKRNYWWYEGIHRLYDMGIWYHLNKWVTIAYVLALGLALLLGWQRFAAFVVSALHVLVALPLSAMILFGCAQDHWEQHGMPIVLLGLSKRKRVDSIVFDLILAAMPVGAAYAHLCVVLEMFCSI